MMPPKDTMRGFSTWLPAMMDALLKTTGPVLEIGSGYGTPILAAYCDNYRLLTTIENDLFWYAHALIEANAWHLVYKSLEDIDPAACWDVGLVDNAPAAERMPIIERLRNRVKILVVHDAQDSGYGYDFSGFDVVRWGPMPETAVLMLPENRDLLLSPRA